MQQARGAGGGAALRGGNAQTTSALRAARCAAPMLLRRRRCGGPCLVAPSAPPATTTTSPDSTSSSSSTNTTSNSTQQQQHILYGSGLFGLKSDEASAVAALSLSLAVGLVLGPGLGVGLDESLPETAQGWSAALGWGYFTAWSLSFWPQILENQRTRRVDGLSADYLLYSLVGYCAYALYNGALGFNDDIRGAYAALHGGALPDVAAADFAFAAHAVVATLVVAAQYATMRRPGQDAGVSPVAAGVAATALLAAALGAAQAGAACAPADGGCAAWLPLLVLLGGTKVAMTLVKYTPQVLHNHARRSTEGWSLANVLLDLSGGALSLAQVGLDAWARHDLSVVTGSPAKLWIAALSLGYDAIFIAQAYWLYRDSDRNNGGADSAAGAVGVVGAQAEQLQEYGRQQEGADGGAEPAAAPAAAHPRATVLAFAQAAGGGRARAPPGGGSGKQP